MKTHIPYDSANSLLGLYLVMPIKASQDMHRNVDGSTGVRNSPKPEVTQTSVSTGLDVQLVIFYEKERTVKRHKSQLPHQNTDKMHRVLAE